MLAVVEVESLLTVKLTPEVLVCVTVSTVDVTAVAVLVTLLMVATSAQIAFHIPAPSNPASSSVLVSTFGQPKSVTLTTVWFCDACCRSASPATAISRSTMACAGEGKTSIPTAVSQLCQASENQYQSSELRHVSSLHLPLH